MFGTIIGFAIVAFFWLRGRAKDKDKGIRAYEDPSHAPDSASTVAAFILLILLMYLAVFLPMPLFIFTPASGYMIAWPLVTFIIIALSWGFTRRLGYLRVPGFLRDFINPMAARINAASNRGFSMKR